MYSYISGMLKHKTPAAAVVDNNGIGYRIFTTGRVLAELSLDEHVTLYTYMHVREDELSLYGFPEAEGVQLFEALLGVTGIGPKAALSICAAGSAMAVYGAIVAGDVAWLTKIPGVGRKTAERLVLELKDKLSRHISLAPGTAHAISYVALTQGVEGQCARALRGLGYGEPEYTPHLKQALALLGPDASVEEALRTVLRTLAQGR
ncbi:MAG: Holliday junction ATP-dependent DNA helicase RuvA [Firmicutes bacterium]|nr:Holliday junction ATP-dependent DNA helicase RuvA [candidate division NPL-UPA2 bacterium]MBT9154559.1 Holliday junction ATP-dependent DNA helicase RuvA [candidate division NPL-UPA2 bacterium]MBT9156359.1 Holliday junction ATP-dependent DNA helicase RuvA [candidate division NPL-UPA2 bacterium]